MSYIINNELYGNKIMIIDTLISFELESKMTSENSPYRINLFMVDSKVFMVNPKSLLKIKIPVEVNNLLSFIYSLTFDSKSSLHTCIQMLHLFSITCCALAPQIYCCSLQIAMYNLPLYAQRSIFFSFQIHIK